MCFLVFSYVVHYFYFLIIKVTLIIVLWLLIMKFKVFFFFKKTLKLINSIEKICTVSFTRTYALVKQHNVDYDKVKQHHVDYDKKKTTCFIYSFIN